MDVFEVVGAVVFGVVVNERVVCLFRVSSLSLVSDGLRFLGGEADGRVLLFWVYLSWLALVPLYQGRQYPQLFLEFGQLFRIRRSFPLSLPLICLSVTFAVEFRLGAGPSLPDVEVVSILAGQKTDHFIYFFLLLLIGFVVDEGRPIFRDALLPIPSLFGLETLPALLALHALLLLILDELDEDLIFAVPGAVRSHGMDDGRALIPNQLLAVDAPGLGLLPDVVILQGDQSLSQLLLSQVQRADLWLLLDPSLFLGVSVVVLVVLHADYMFYYAFRFWVYFIAIYSGRSEREVVL